MLRIAVVQRKMQALRNVFSHFRFSFLFPFCWVGTSISIFKAYVYMPEHVSMHVPNICLGISGALRLIVRVTV